MNQLSDMDPIAVKTMYDFQKAELVRWSELREEKTKELELLQQQIIALIKEVGRTGYYLINCQSQIKTMEEVFPDLKQHLEKLN